MRNFVTSVWLQFCTGLPPYSPGDFWSDLSPGADLGSCFTLTQKISAPPICILMNGVSVQGLVAIYRSYSKYFWHLNISETLILQNVSNKGGTVHQRVNGRQVFVIEMIQISLHWSVLSCRCTSLLKLPINEVYLVWPIRFFILAA